MKEIKRLFSHFCYRVFKQFAALQLVNGINWGKQFYLDEDKSRVHQLIACNDKELKTNWKKKLTLVVSVSKHCSSTNLSSVNFQLSNRNLLAPSAGHKQLCFGEARGFNKLVVKHLAKEKWVFIITSINKYNSIYKYLLMTNTQQVCSLSTLLCANFN